MADRQIPFSAPMVVALLSGTKTQTRRLCDLSGATAPIIEMVKVATDKATGRAIYEMKDAAGAFVGIRGGKHFMSTHYMARYAVGDRLWVREAWRTTKGLDIYSGSEIAEQCLYGGFAKPWAPVEYVADGARSDPLHWQDEMPGRYRHGRFMPRWASRLTLTVTDVRVQRLHDISEADAIAEGVDFDSDYASLCVNIEGAGYANDLPKGSAAIAIYRRLWDDINGPGSWDANPWVAAYTFTVERGNIDG